MFGVHELGPSSPIRHEREKGLPTFGVRQQGTCPPIRHDKKSMSLQCSMFINLAIVLQSATREESLCL